MSVVVVSGVRCQFIIFYMSVTIGCFSFCLLFSNSLDAATWARRDNLVPVGRFGLTNVVGSKVIPFGNPAAACWNLKPKY